MPRNYIRKTPKKTIPKASPKYWTGMEVHKLKTDYLNGVPLKIIEVELRRNRGSITKKLKQLNIVNRKGILDKTGIKFQILLTQEINDDLGRLAQAKHTHKATFVRKLILQAIEDFKKGK